MNNPLRRFLLLPTAVAILVAAWGCSGGGESPPAAAPPPVIVGVGASIDIAQPWVIASPAASGLDEVMLTRAVNDAAAMPRFRSLLIARYGKLVVEQYFGGSDASTLFDARSVTKSVVSLLSGVALASGKLPSLDATVGDYVGTPYLLDAGDRAITMRQLLTMTSGYQWNENTGDDYNLWVTSDDPVQFLFDRSQPGGGNFVYDSAAVNLLGHVLQLAVAQPLPQFAEETLFQPIGITSADWEALEPGMVNGGSGIKMTAQDLLRLGQLLLQRGRSGSAQIVPVSWIDEMTTPKFTWRDVHGAQRGTTYGYLWWLAEPPAVRAHFAWGYGGQFVYVVPSYALVVVTTTQWQGISAETSPTAFAEQILTLIVNDILSAVRT